MTNHYVRPKWGEKIPNNVCKERPENPIRAFRYRYCTSAKDLPSHLCPNSVRRIRPWLPAYVRFQSAGDLADEIGVKKSHILKAETYQIPVPGPDIFFRLYNYMNESQFLEMVRYYADKHLKDKETKRPPT